MNIQQQIHELEKKCEVLLTLLMKTEDDYKKIYELYQTYMKQLEELTKDE